MIYFDNAATSFPKPPEVREAMAEAVDSFGNPSRGAHGYALEAARCMTKARVALAELFEVERTERVVFTKSVTEALNMAISAIEGHIVTTAAEHNAVLRPVYRHGEYTIIPVDEWGNYEADALEAALRTDTEAVVIGHASNLTGNVVPLADIGKLCQSRGVRLIVDAAQTAGLLPISLTAMGIDALCFTGHKALYGPAGTGGICLRESFTPRPLLVGGSGNHSFETTQPEVLPDLLEAGTQNVFGIAGLLAGVRYAQSHSGLLEQGNEVAKYFWERSKQLPDVTHYGQFQREPRVPIVTLNLGQMSSGEVADRLGERGIAVRGGIHCAPLLHTRFGTKQQGAVRFSFSHQNTLEEADKALLALQEIAASKRYK